MDERLAQINRCMLELERARIDYKINPFGSIQSELDWLEELHCRLHNHKEEVC